MVLQTKRLGEADITRKYFFIQFFEFFQGTWISDKQQFFWKINCVSKTDKAPSVYQKQCNK
jgi:hypothetical protein